MLKYFTDKIAKNSKIALYGAGMNAPVIKRYLEENRPDVEILFYVDTYKTGEQDGLKIVNLADLPTHKDLFDIMVVTIRRSSHKLKGVFDFFDINSLFITYEDEQVIKKIQQKETYCPYIDKQRKAVQCLTADNDKKVYNMIWNARINSDYKEIAEYVYKRYQISSYGLARNYNAQYMEYINKDAIKTILDGGFCNGIQSLIFKKQLKNLEKLYAFEPMYEKFKEPAYDKFIKDENFVKIIPYGLWNESKDIEFCENTLIKSGSRVLGTRDKPEAAPHENIIKIKTTTIDEIKEKEQIEKVDFIKMDIEGAELPALMGAEKTILKDRPQLTISIYHSIGDFVSIPLYLKDLLTDYSLHIGHYSTNIYETVLYAIPRELETKGK